MTNWKTIRKKILADAEVKKLYDNMGIEYAVIEKIIAMRQERGWTQTELAKRLGTTQSALARVESGNFNPKLEFLKKLASAFDSQLFIEFR